MTAEVVSLEVQAADHRVGGGTLAAALESAAPARRTSLGSIAAAELEAREVDQHWQRWAAIIKLKRVAGKRHVSEVRSVMSREGDAAAWREVGLATQ